MAKHVYPVKVHVQTFWVEVDDETGIATEHADLGAMIPAARWPGFYLSWLADFAAMRAQVEAVPEVKSEE